MREYGPASPLVFSHIPKTAGTSLTAALREAMSPQRFVFGIDMSLSAGYNDVRVVRPSMRSMIFLDPSELPADADLVAGHIAPSTTMTRYPGADHITVLRVPQNRQISQWLHCRSLSELSLRHWGVAADAFRLGRLPLADYLWQRMIAPSLDNTITRFLTWPHPLVPKLDFIDEAHDEELFAAAIVRLDEFAYVDVAENPRLMADLGGWLGREVPQVRLNERSSVPPRMRPDLAAEMTDAARELLDHRSRIDARIWCHVAHRVLPDTDPQQLLEAEVRRSLDRYADMLRRPDTRSLLRRTAERTYELGTALNPRRHTLARIAERPGGERSASVSAGRARRR
jgi:hypothetical protein